MAFIRYVPSSVIISYLHITVMGARLYYPYHIGNGRFATLIYENIRVMFSYIMRIRALESLGALLIRRIDVGVDGTTVDVLRWPRYRRRNARQRRL